LLERDAQVLSEDDMALMRALNNEYLYYEQQRNEPVMRALGYEAVKIRRRDVYFDQYNRGPYANLEGYEGDGEVSVEAYVMSPGTAWLYGGENEGADFAFSVETLIIPGNVTTVLDLLQAFLSFTDEQKAKLVLEEGDVEIQVNDHYLYIKRNSFYKRDGTHVFSETRGWHKKSPMKYEVIDDVNPDLDLRSLAETFQEVVKGQLTSELLERIRDKIIRLVKT